MNQLTVNKAIKKGHQMVNYPVFAIMIIGFGLTIYFMTLKLNSLFVGLFGVSTFVLMWLWWSIQITRWKILAFGNVRNVHELKRKAIEQQLIWNDSSWFNKTEIWSQEQKQKWSKIEKKFLQEDEFESILDDGRIPDKTIVKNSGALKWIYGAMILGCLILAYIQIRENETFLFMLLIGISILGGMFLLPKVWDSSPQIILTNEGIKFKDAKMVSWDEVKKANVVLQGRGKSAKWYLDIDYRSKDSKGDLGEYIELSNFDPNPGKIEERIKIYRQREKKRKNR
jgi:hypothetical protein